MEDNSDERIDEIVAEFLDAAERGEAVESEALFRRHPALEAPLRARLRALGHLDACLEQLREVPRSEGVPEPRIKGYRILERLGQGGMGAVFLAEQESLKRLVAVKVLSPFGTADARAVERFRREAETIARLSHPGIVSIHEFGTENGTPYLTIDFVPGLDLAGILAGLRESSAPPSGADIQRLIDGNIEELAALAAKHDARVAPPKAGGGFWSRPYPDICASVVMGVAEALDFAHSRGVMHRDIKPSNVILDSDGSSRLIDFGLTLSESASALTRPTDFIGSAPYCSPEQVTGDEPMSFASEVFSLGTMLHEMLSLRRPFDGRTVSEILSRVARAKPEPLRDATPGTPRELQDICRMAMARNPRRRYATAGAMAADLGRYLKGESVSARPRMKRRQAAWIAVSSLLLVVGSVLWFRPAKVPSDIAPPPQAPSVSRGPALKKTAMRSPAPLTPDAAPDVRKLMAVGRLKDAAERLEKRLSSSPGDFESRVLAAWIRLELGDFAAALDHARAAAALAPRRSEGHKVLGHALLQVKRYPEAVRALAAAVEISPEDYKIRLPYAEALGMSGEFEAAEKQYALCAVQAPKDTQALQGYGAALARRGDLSGAVRQYKKSLELSSGDARAHLLVAELLAGLQRDEEAVYYYTKAESLATSAEDRLAAREGLSRLSKQAR
ncbi:MAG: protein kinase [Elusimicrobia bacterium]|nr:protein kinase [Elusimicrobiota bacterium]